MPNSIGEENGQLKKQLSPVLNTPSPLTGDIHSGQVEHLKQRLIRRENALALRDFTELTMVALNHVCGVDELTDFRWVLEETSRVLPSSFAKSVQ